jgi:MinD superfamily P-loop ATPase
MQTRMIAVVSDKGGVGKTTAATSIAHGLARQDARVLLVDFDLLGQDAIVLGMSPEPGVRRLARWCERRGGPACRCCRETDGHARRTMSCGGGRWVT